MEDILALNKRLDFDTRTKRHLRGINSLVVHRSTQQDIAFEDQAMSQVCDGVVGHIFFPVLLDDLLLTKRNICMVLTQFIAFKANIWHVVAVLNRHAWLPSVAASSHRDDQTRNDGGQ